MNYMNLNYKKLIESLKLLSITYLEQKSFFPDFVDLPFELSDTYHNVFILLPELIEEKLFTYEVISNLMRLEIMLNRIMNDPSYDNLNEQKFLENKEWSNVRSLAKKILNQNGELLAKPDSNYI